MSKQFFIDAGERVLSSFAEGVLAAVLAGALAKGLNASSGHVLLYAGLTAAATTLKAVIASLLPTAGASLVPTKRRKPKVRKKA